MTVEFDELEKKLMEFSRKANDTYAGLSNCFLEVEKIKVKHDSLSKSNDTKASTADLHDQVSQLLAFIDQTKKKVLYLDDQKDLMNALLREVKNNCIEFRQTFDDHAKKAVDASKVSDDIKDSIRVARDDLDSNMNSCVRAAKVELHSKIDNLPIPRDTIGLEQVRKEIASSVESIALDSKNAHLGTQQHEMRLSILEKKIDGIVLQLKNAELKAK